MKTIIIKLALTVGVAMLLAVAAAGVADRVGEEYTERSFKRALVTFAVARGLNAVISVAQGTEIAVEPAGVGVNFTPGQVLDPINDLVEQFSWVMLASATVLGLQRLLLELSALPVFTGALVMTWMVVLALWWWPRALPHWRAVSLRIGVLLLVVRFAVPLLAVSSELFYEAFLYQRYTHAAERIEQTTVDIRSINQGAAGEASATEELSLLERARRAYQSAVAIVDMRGYLSRYEQAAADVSEQVVNLIVVFVVQTVLLPLLFLWGGWRLLGWIWQWPLPGAGRRVTGME